MRKVAINGFGRIGRNVFRIIMEQEDDLFGGDVQVVAINDLGDPKTMAHLLKYDSTLGVAPFEVSHDEKALYVNGLRIPILSERDPANLPWRELEVDVVAECTGVFTKRADVAKHLEAGAKKVIISAPSPDPDIMIVLGANEDQYDPHLHHVISNASCTTNCLAPLVKVVDEAFGIRHGLMTTVHAYTADQRLQDLPHKDLRRARAAAENIIPTSTGAAKAIGRILPNLDGKLNGVAVRVPVAAGSIIDLCVELEKQPSVDELNQAISQAAANDPRLQGILRYTDDPIVSSDIERDSASCVFDSLLTQQMGSMYKLFAWYQNEWGYSSRMVDLIKLV